MFTVMNDRVERTDKLEERIRQFISDWDGTVAGQTVKNMLKNGGDYESICEVIGIDYDDYVTYV